jgi:hypothetical protein
MGIGRTLLESLIVEALEIGYSKRRGNTSSQPSSWAGFVFDVITQGNFPRIGKIPSSHWESLFGKVNESRSGFSTHPERSKPNMTAERGNVGRGFLLQWVLANVVGLAVGWGSEDGFAGAFGFEGPTSRNIVSHLVGFLVGGAVIGLAQWLVLRDRVQRSGWVSLPITLAPAALALVPLVVLLLGLSAAATRPDPGTPGPLWVELVIVVFGALVLGIAVAGVLRLVMRRSMGWAGWGVLASSVAFPVGFITGFAFGPAGSLIMPVAMVGLACGITQWRALRGQVSRPGWWVLANTLGLTAGAAAGVGWISLLNTLTGTNNYEQWLTSVMVMASFGAVTGAVGGAITGGALVRLLRHPVRAEEVVAASA